MAGRARSSNTSSSPRCCDEFDVVIPSLPGYGFSERPRAATTRDTARLWHRLMQGLGYERYGAQGGDFGASVSPTWRSTSRRRCSASTCTRSTTRRTRAGRPPSAAEREYRERGRPNGTRPSAATARSSRPSRRPSATGSTTRQPAWRPGSSRSGARGATPGRLRFDRDCCSPTDDLLGHGDDHTSMRDYYDERWHGTPSDRTTSSPSRPRSRCSRTSSSPRARRRASGPSGLRRPALDRDAARRPLRAAEEPELLARTSRSSSPSCAEHRDQHDARDEGVERRRHDPPRGVALRDLAHHRPRGCRRDGKGEGGEGDDDDDAGGAGGHGQQPRRCRLPSPFSAVTRRRRARRRPPRPRSSPGRARPRRPIRLRRDAPAQGR